MVNISSFSFNSIHLEIIAKLETSFSQDNVIVQYKIDIGSDGDIMS